MIKTSGYGFSAGSNTLERKGAQQFQERVVLCTPDTVSLYEYSIKTEQNLSRTHPTTIG